MSDQPHKWTNRGDGQCTLCGMSQTIMVHTNAFPDPRGPFTIQRVKILKSTFNGMHYRITDADDNRIGTCYTEGNAEFIVRALNEYFLKHAK